MGRDRGQAADARRRDRRSHRDRIVALREPAAGDRRHGANTQLIANARALDDDWKRTKLDNIALLLKAAIEAQGRVGIMLNVRKDDLEAVLALLPALQQPTISPLSDASWVALNTIIEERTVRYLIPKLKAARAQGIVDTRSTRLCSEHADFDHVHGARNTRMTDAIGFRTCLINREGRLVVRASAASESRDRSAPAKRRARERVGSPRGKAPRERLDRQQMQIIQSSNARAVASLLDARPGRTPRSSAAWHRLSSECGATATRRWPGTLAGSMVSANRLKSPAASSTRVRRSSTAAFAKPSPSRQRTSGRSPSVNDRDRGQ